MQPTFFRPRPETSKVSLLPNSVDHSNSKGAIDSTIGGKLYLHDGECVKLLSSLQKTPTITIHAGTYGKRRGD